MGIIYRLDFQSEKIYIGQTVRTLCARIAQHRQAVAFGSTLPVHCAWRLHGEPKISIIAECDDESKLHDLEREFIQNVNTLSPNGYNISLGGDTAPSKSPEVAAKISAKAMGRVVSEDVKATISEKMKARWKDPEYVARVTAGLRAAQNEELSLAISERSKKMWAARKEAGWEMPESTKEKIRARVFSDEARAKMSVAAKRRGISPQTRAANIAAIRGVKRGPYSQERKDKAAAGVKAAWNDPEKRARLMAARKAAWETRRAKQKKEGSED